MHIHAQWETCWRIYATNTHTPSTTPKHPGEKDENERKTKGQRTWPFYACASGCISICMCVPKCVCVYPCVQCAGACPAFVYRYAVCCCRLIYWRFVLCPMLRWCSLALWAFILAVIIRHLRYTSSGSCHLSLYLSLSLLPSLSALKSVKQLSVIFFFFSLFYFRVLCFFFF